MLAVSDLLLRTDDCNNNYVLRRKQYIIVNYERKLKLLDLDYGFPPD